MTITNVLRTEGYNKNQEKLSKKRHTPHYKLFLALSAFGPWNRLSNVTAEVQQN